MAFNIADLFEHAVDKFPDRMALACGEEQLTFAELETRANRLAHHLAAQGVGTGTHVGMCLRNRVEAIETMLAVYKLRAVLININFRYTAKEIRYVLDNADVVAVVYESAFAEQVRKGADGLPLVTHLLEVDSGGTPADEGVASGGPPVDKGVADGGGGGYEPALASAGPERDFGERSNDDLYILYTGGTTGMPKGVMWRHEDVWRTLGGGISFISGEPLEDEWAQSGMGELTGGLTRLCLAPLIHGNAQWAALMALFGGDPVVLLRQFDAHEAWRAIERHRVNVVVLIGDAMARPLVEAYVDSARDGQYDASSVFAISSSAALFSQSVKNQFLEALPNSLLTDSLGSSETGFMGMGMITKDAAPASGGPRITLNADSIVIDEDDRQIPPGDARIGRLARGGHIPLGYYKDEEKTKRLFVEVDGKRYTVPGDFARHEDDGTITLLGRGNTCVNTGGEKVFPEEVEEALMSHPDVFDVLVIGVPDERLGQRVAAVVELRPGAAQDAEALIAHARTEVAGYKVPKSIWFVDKVHRLATGKADYRWASGHAGEHPGEDACAPRSATS